MNSSKTEKEQIILAHNELNTLNNNKSENRQKNSSLNGSVKRTSFFKRLNFFRNTAQNMHSDELKQARQKLEMHINNTPLAVVEWDLNYKVTRWNKAAETIFGFTADEIIGKHSYAILEEKTRPLVDDIFKNVLSQTGGSRSTNTNLTKKGEKIWCEWYNTPLINNNGEVVGVASLVQNISKRKNAEIELLKKHHELEAAEEELRAVNEELLETNTELKNKMHELEAAEEELRASNEELTATNDALKNNMQELEAAEHKICASLEEVQEKNKLLVIKEEALNNANEMLQLVIDHIPQRVFWKDTNSDYLGCNKVFAQDAGFDSYEDILGKNDLDIYDHNFATKYQAFDSEVMQSGIAKFNIEEVEQQTNGETKVFLTNRVPIKNRSGKIIGVLGTYENITNQKKNQEELVHAKLKAEESDRLKSAFLANMSHEIRTPMNGIIGFSQLLELDKNLSEKALNYLKIITSSGEQLLSIVDDILNISKIETGLFSLNKNKVNITKLLTDIHPIFEIKAQNNSNKINLHLSNTETELLITTDGTRLRQILSNLLTNALKFTVNGTVDYGYTINDNYIQFFVKDTGIGIAKDKIKTVFERFMQVNATIAHNKGGVGLGLSICKGLTELMGGKIWVESEEGKGSTFYFTLPMTQIQKEINKNIINKTDIDNLNLKGLNILVAEDDLSNHLVIEHMLKESQVNIIKAYNGEEAIEKIESNPQINLVLMDIKMPVINGFDAALKLREKYPNIPIIAQTAFAFDENKQEFNDARFDNYITKPIDRVELLESIKLALLNA